MNEAVQWLLIIGVWLVLGCAMFSIFHLIKALEHMNSVLTMLIDKKRGTTVEEGESDG